MSVIYSTACITARMNAVVTQIDAGAGFGALVLLAGGTLISTITLQKPSGTVNLGVLTFNGALSDPGAAGTGFVTTAQVRDSNANVIISGFTVGISGSGADIIIANGSNTTFIQSGQSVQLLAAQITGS